MNTPRHRSLLKTATITVLVVLLTLTAMAKPLPAPLPENVRLAIEQFLAHQTADLPGKVLIRIDSPQSGYLPTCEALEPFVPSGARLWGRVSIGVRCLSGQPWIRYVPAYIAVMGSYYVASHAINFGKPLVPTDVTLREGDLTTLPASVITDVAQLEGMTASNRIASGTPLRRDQLHGTLLIQQGQNVKIITKGTGFVIGAEGKAMTSAAVGSILQVKMQGGQLISGKVRSNGTIERSN